MKLSLLTAATLVVGTLAAQYPPPAFVVETLLTTNLNAPTDLAWLSDGRALIANRDGVLSMLIGPNHHNLGIVPGVETGSERCLLSVCPDPNFATNGHLYVWYSSANDNFMHLDRFTCTGDLNNSASAAIWLDTNSRHAILATPDNHPSHNGGSTRFGPDGMLYLTTGDDGVACDAQVPASGSGALLRLNVAQLPPGANATPYTPDALDPGTNPLSANTDFSQLVIAHGLRNPVRMDIDPLTNHIYVADVGGSSFEEYNEYRYVPGNLNLINFGWPWREGTANPMTCGGTPPAGMTDPILAISQAENWYAILGGPRYRNTGGAFDFGSAYEGVAFCADYFSGEIRMLVENQGVWGPAPPVPGQADPVRWATGTLALTSLRVGPDGALYLLEQNGPYSTNGGTLKRIRPQGPLPQVSVVSGNHQFGPAAETFPLPLVVRVRDAQGQPMANTPVNFAVSGPGYVTPFNPVLTDGQGLASVQASAILGGGEISVGAYTANGPSSTASFRLFSRKLIMTATPTSATVTVTNTTTATPPLIPYLLMASAPGITPWQSFLGPVCTDPFHASTLVVEDSIGIYGFASFGGNGAMGSPALSLQYQLPPGLLTGLTLQFQAFGVDPVLGAFRTNCTTLTFP